MFSALLDTCVLWPSLQRDFLLSLAIEGMYRPLWSSAILAELEYEEAAKWVRRNVTEQDASRRARRLIERMRVAFDDAEVTGWEPLDGTYGLPDPDDEHVVAAAFVGGAGAIVTLNSTDFPGHRLPAGLAVLTPAQFAENTVALGPAHAWDAIDAIVRRSGRNGPPLSSAEILTLLESRYSMGGAVELLRTSRECFGR